MKLYCVKKNNHGFTLIELIISISLSALLAGAAVPVYSSFQNSVALSEAFETAVQELQLARKLAVSGRLSSSYGVYLDEDAGAVVFYRGANFAERDLDSERRTVFSQDVVLENQMLSRDVNFSAGRGVPSEVGTFSLRFKDNLRSVSINDFGLILEN